MDSRVLKKQGALAMQNQENGFEEFVRGFVNNVRALIREVPSSPEWGR